MKRNLVTCLALLLSVSMFAQEAADTEQKGKFKKENIFLGTSLNLGIASRSFNVGLNPEIGYSVSNWLDAGVSFNINYFSQNASDYSPYRFRNFNYGGGPFLRVWPLNFLHLQIQPEFNWISSSQKDMTTNQTYKYNYNAGSLLLGIGYGTRIIGSQYQYITLMIDVLQNANSPYRDRFNDPLPVLRAGFGMYLNRRHR